LRQINLAKKTQTSGKFLLTSAFFTNTRVFFFYFCVSFKKRYIKQAKPIRKHSTLILSPQKNN